MIAEATDAPTVAGINALDFTWCDGSDIGLETRSCFGVELTLPVGMFDTPAITSTSQLVVVGEYNEVIDINNTGDFMINLEPGFAEQYFE